MILFHTYHEDTFTAAKARFLALRLFCAVKKERLYMNTKKLTVTGLLLALSILLPQLFHLIGGPSMGRIFLPLHLGVFLIGFVVGGWHGMIAGLLVPLLSFAFTGMPAPPVLFFLMCELCVYGAVSGFLRFSNRFEQSKLSIYPKLLIAMILGRIASGLAMLVAGMFFGLDIDPVSAVITALIAGLPGILLQIVLLPPIYLLLKRGGFVFERN